MEHETAKQTPLGDVSGWARTSNWGRWGREDERGALNLIPAASLVKALRIPVTGKVYSLSVEVSPTAPSSAIRAKPWRSLSVSGGRPGPTTVGSADETLVLQYHGATTHVDALCHMWYDHKVYNGFDELGLFHRTAGATRCGIDKAGAIIGRGVLLDLVSFKGMEMLPVGYAVTPDELEACARKQGIAIKSGDIVLMRTGWLKEARKNPPTKWMGEGGPGMAALEWFHKKEVVALGADNVGVEATPAEDKVSQMPFHQRWLRDVGGYLIEFLELDELARDHAYEFLFITVPLKIAGGVGSPVHPIAIV